MRCPSPGLRKGGFMPQMYGAWRPPKPQPCHTLQNYILQSLGVSVTTAVPHCCALECVASFTRGTYIAHRKWNCLIVMQVWKRANGGHKPPTLFTPSSPCHQLRPLLPLRAQLPHEVIRLLACPRRHPPAHLPHHRPEAEGVCRRRRPRLQQLRRGREAAPADSHRGGGASQHPTAVGRLEGPACHTAREENRPRPTWTHQ